MKHSYNIASIFRVILAIIIIIIIYNDKSYFLSFFFPLPWHNQHCNRHRHLLMEMPINVVVAIANSSIRILLPVLNLSEG